MTLVCSDICTGSCNVFYYCICIFISMCVTVSIESEMGGAERDDNAVLNERAEQSRAGVG